MNTRWFFISLLAIFFGCRSQAPDSRHIEQLADTYAAVVQCKMQNKNIDSVHYQQKLDSILNQHGYTKQQFQHELEDLCIDPNQFRAFGDLAMKKMQERKT